MYICMKDTFIYITVDGEGCDPLPFPESEAEQKKILLQVKNWVESLKDFDSYDSNLSIRVIDRSGNMLYSLSTGHAWSAVERVKDAIYYVKYPQATEETVA